MSRNPRNYIGPTIRSGKPAVIPEGPVADFSHRATKGMLAASGRLGKEVKLEGQRIEAPLQTGPPIEIPESLQTQKPEPEKPILKPREKTQTEKEVSTDVLMGNNQFGSLNALLERDQLEKPRIRAWENDED